MRQGLIHAYCGNGKGKTTASIGLSIRAIGRGMKVIIIQFLKSKDTGELSCLAKLEPEVRVFRFEKKRGFVWTLNDKEKEELKSEIRNALKFAKKVLDTRECDLLILDEILGAVECGLIAVKELEELLKGKPQEIELVLTGRVVPEELRENIDYISNICCEKHPYEKGIPAREGIEY